MSTRDKYNKILPVMLNIATIATSHGTSQFTHYFEVTRQAEKFMREGSELNIIVPREEGTSVENEEPPEESHTLTPDPSEKTGKFQDLQFRPKVKARGRPKRSQRQLCSFNKGAVDREGAESSRRGRK